MTNVTIAERLRVQGAKTSMWFPRIVALWVIASVAPAADSSACAACHRAIYESYRRTPMAATSGQAGRGVPAESFANAGFTHASSGFRYRVSRSGGGYWMDFEKAADGSLHGRKPLAYFAGSGAGMRVTSHFEKLAQSACKRASGDRLWCGSCHDPHTVPTAAGRAAWFRAKCRSCHAADACAETAANRASRQDDCAACHMPKGGVTDAEHVVYTDHAIPRRPGPAAMAPPQDGELVPFGGGAASPRDLALAYAIVATRAGAAGRDRAMQLLEAAQRHSRDDVEVLLYLAEIYRNTGREDRAIPLYRRAMRLDPGQVTASVGLCGILFERGDDREAIRLWQDALAKNGGLVLVATNLAMAQWRSGERAPAVATLRKVIDLSPGFQPARDLLKRLEEALAKK